MHVYSINIVFYPKYHSLSLVFLSFSKAGESLSFLTDPRDKNGAPMQLLISVPHA